MSTLETLRRRNTNPIRGTQRGLMRSVRARRRSYPEVLPLEDRQLLTGSGTFAFDFGPASAPLAAGYTRVSQSTAFSSTLGYGWTAGAIDAEDRGTPAAPLRDLCDASSGSFAVNVADGTYSVTLSSGDENYGHDDEGFYLQGKQVDEITTPIGQFVTHTYQTTVTNGQLVLSFKDLGGKDPNCVINALTIQLTNPGVSVTTSPSPTAGQAVSFAGVATGGTAPYTYQWSFGDGTEATGTTTSISDLSHIYANPGTYTATLSVTDSHGLTGTATVPLTVADVGPTAAVAVPSTGLTNTPLEFAAIANDISPAVEAAGFSFSWNFGDGGTSTGATPSHTYATAGTYKVTVTATDAHNVSGTATGTVVISDSIATAYTLTAPSPADCAIGVPSNVFTIGLPTGETLSAPVTINLSDNGARGLFSPASVVLSAASPTATFTYTAAGSGAIAISTTNNGGLVDPSPVSITAQQPVTNYTVVAPSSGSVGSPVTFTITLGSGWLTNPVQITPSVTGVSGASLTDQTSSFSDGTFSPSSITLTQGSRTATFTYTPQLYGSENISFANNGGQTNPTPMAFLSEVQIGSSGTAASGNQAPDLGGFDFFTNGAWWQAIGSPASDYGAAPNSASLISAFGSSNIQIDWSTTTANGGDSLYGMPYNVVPGNQPLVPVTLGAYANQSTANSAPFYTGMSIEGIQGPPPVYPPSDDMHGLVMVRNETTGGIAYLYEGYQVGWDSTTNTWAATELSEFNLLTGTPPPEFDTTSDAAGLPVSPLLVNYNEAALAAAGGPAIDHPFRVCISASLVMNDFVWPARHGVTVGSATSGLPMGARLQLSTAWYNANISKFDPIDRAIVTAMYQYGVIVADVTTGGGIWLEGTNDQRWTTPELNALATIPDSAFQVLNTIQSPVSFTGPSTGTVGTPQAFSIQYLISGDSNFSSQIWVAESANQGKTWTYIDEFNLGDASRGPFSFNFTPTAAGTYMFKINYGGNDWILPPTLSFTATAAGSTAAPTSSPASPSSGGGAMMALTGGDDGGASSSTGGGATSPQAIVGGNRAMVSLHSRKHHGSHVSHPRRPAAQNARPRQATTVTIRGLHAGSSTELIAPSARVSAPLQGPKDEA